ncbi:hypothetical protein [Kribbella sp. NPDC051770]
MQDKRVRRTPDRRPTGPRGAHASGPAVADAGAAVGDLLIVFSP